MPSILSVEPEVYLCFVGKVKCIKKALMIMFIYEVFVAIKPSKVLKII